MGYRDLVERETFGIDIKGYVENIADDKVRIVAEDPEEFREIREELVSIKDAPVKPA